MNANIARKHIFMKLSMSLRATFMLWRDNMICFTFRPSNLITILTLRSYGHLSLFFILLYLKILYVTKMLLYMNYDFTKTKYVVSGNRFVSYWNCQLLELGD